MIWGFAFIFTIGGLRGVGLVNGFIGIAFCHNYHVLAHFHYVLRIDAIFALFSAWKKKCCKTKKKKTWMVWTQQIKPK